MGSWAANGEATSATACNSRSTVFVHRTDHRTLYFTMRALRFLALALFVLSAVGAARATHNRAGEIIVCQVSGFTYEVTIVTHTKLSAPADRPELVLDWGDGLPLDTIERITIDNFPLRDLCWSTYVA